MEADQPPRTIAPATRAEAREALELLFSRLAPKAREEQVAALFAALLSGEIPLGGLWTARRGSRLVGAALAQVQPGRTALVWMPRLIDGEPAATGRALLGSVDEMLAAAGVVVANMLPAEPAASDRALLRAAGYRHLARLHYLASPRGEFPSEPPESPLRFEGYSTENHKRLTGVVEATYAQTLDCPDLDGIRHIEDTLVGYQTTGVFDPSRWLLIRHADRDVGCLLLADHPAQDSWELVYMGVVPEARGNGWGRVIVRHAQWLTGEAGRSCLVLAVDAANAPALGVYGSLGFQQWEEREVYIKVFGDSA